MLPPVLRDFAARYPKVKLELHQGNPVQVAEHTASGDADVGIATEALAGFPELVTLPCYQWNRCVLVPRGHPLGKTAPLTLAALARYPIVTYDFSFTGRSQINAAFDAEGLVPNVVLTALDSDVIKTYVEMGMGVGHHRADGVGSGARYGVRDARCRAPVRAVDDAHRAAPRRVPARLRLRFHPSLRPGARPRDGRCGARGRRRRRGRRRGRARARTRRRAARGDGAAPLVGARRTACLAVDARRRSRSTPTCPRFPPSARDFSATSIAVQQTLSAYLFAFAGMMLWHGALSDALGRRPVVLAGLVVYAIATLGCAIAGNIAVAVALPRAAGHVRRHGPRDRARDHPRPLPWRRRRSA